MLWLRARLGASCAAPFAPDIQKDWLVKAGGSCWLWKLLELVRWSRPGIGFVSKPEIQPLLLISMPPPQSERPSHPVGLLHRFTAPLLARHTRFPRLQF